MIWKTCPEPNYRGRDETRKRIVPLTPRCPSPDTRPTYRRRTKKKNVQKKKKDPHYSTWWRLNVVSLSVNCTHFSSAYVNFMLRLCFERNVWRPNGISMLLGCGMGHPSNTKEAPVSRSFSSSSSLFCSAFSFVSSDRLDAGSRMYANLPVQWITWKHKMKNTLRNRRVSLSRAFCSRASCKTQSTKFARRFFRLEKTTRGF